MTALLGDTAEDRSKPLGLKALLNSLTSSANAGLSEEGPLLQST